MHAPCICSGRQDILQESDPVNPERRTNPYFHLPCYLPDARGKAMDNPTRLFIRFTLLRSSDTVRYAKECLAQATWAYLCK